jgi:hypothetical protein
MIGHFPFLSFHLNERVFVFVLIRVISWTALLGSQPDPRNHIYEEVARVKRKVKTHFTADAVAPFWVY